MNEILLFLYETYAIDRGLDFNEKCLNFHNLPISLIAKNFFADFGYRSALRDLEQKPLIVSRILMSMMLIDLELCFSANQFHPGNAFNPGHVFEFLSFKLGLEKAIFRSKTPRGSIKYILAHWTGRGYFINSVSVGDIIIDKHTIVVY